MNWFENIISQAEAEVVKVENAAAAVAPEIKADIAAAKAALANPVIQEFITFFRSFTTHTATPGAAVVVEPSVTTS